MMIAVNAQLADWQTAGQWSEAATNWCNRQAINGFPGICRVHRAEIMRLRGAFSEAEEEARMATGELASFNLMFTAMAFRELGEIRVKMGDLDAAEEALPQASEMGVPPQPGLALVLVQRGRPRRLRRALRRALADTSLKPLDRAKLLPAQLDVALLLDDVETARCRRRRARRHREAHTRAPALRATADAGAAAVALADGALGEAEQAARRRPVALRRDRPLLRVRPRRGAAGTDPSGTGERRRRPRRADRCGDGSRGHRGHARRDQGSRPASNVERLKGLLASVVANLPSPDGCACSTWADDLELTYEIP